MPANYNRRVPANRAQMLIPPCPPLNLSVELTGKMAANDAAFLALPAKPGVLIIEDDSGGTLSLLQTGDLRRAARVRLGPIDPEQPRSRRVDLRPIAKRVLAVTVGSNFESDWATLQLARIRMPHSYKSMLDRWQAWFVHCDAEREFPEWVKTCHPMGEPGVFAGPFADKHAAARFREMLEDAFDLCRFHHILVQAPNGSACAYKEMGRCPAPCDGTASMQHYHEQIRRSITFARQPMNARTSMEREMRERGAALDFEGALRCKTLLERTELSSRHEFAQVRDFDAFRFLAALPAERIGAARLFAIVGGWICPITDVTDLKDAAAIRAALACAKDAAPQSPGHSPWEIENIGMVCRHLLLPKAETKRRRAEFLHWDDHQPDVPLVMKAVARVLRDESALDQAHDPKGPAEQEIEICS